MLTVMFFMIYGVTVFMNSVKCIYTDFTIKNANNILKRISSLLMVLETETTQKHYSVLKYKWQEC